MAYARIIAEHEIPNALIRGFMHEMFGHALYVLDDVNDKGVGLVLQCTWPNGVEIVSLDQVRDFRHYDFTFPGIEEAIAYGKTLIGTKYDLRNIEGFMFDPSLHDPNRLICSRFLIETSSVGQQKVGAKPLLNPAIAFWHVDPSHLMFSPEITELDRWPKTLQL